MNKKGMIKFVSVEVGLPETIVAEVVKSLLNHIISGVTIGCKMHLVGFGRFSKVTHRARVGWDPDKRVTKMLPSMDYVKFEAGEAFKNTIRGKIR